MIRKILFLTGTRADFGKLKPLIEAVNAVQEFKAYLFVTGMHTLARYGYTLDEVHKCFGFKHVVSYMNQIHGEPMDLVLANTISGLSRYVHETRPDMLVVHGDRIEALAGAIVGILNNILVAHVEGGELSGTVDDTIRHCVSKLSHLHFVANNEALERVKQLGESPDNIFVIGSPDVDAMLSSNLPSITEVKERYGISFDSYGIALFHPVTTELSQLRHESNELVSALMKSEHNFIVIYPNNDQGCEDIFSAYTRLQGNPRFRIYPSLRFEYFLTLLKHSNFIIGNSSAGVREAPVYGVFSINVGSRQQDRFRYPSILNVLPEENDILDAIIEVSTMSPCEPSLHFGRGDSSAQFIQYLKKGKLWETPVQKSFYDLIINKQVFGNDDAIA